MTSRIPKVSKTGSLNSFTEEIFYSPSKGNLIFDQIISELSKYTNEEPNSNYRIYVGTDSKIAKRNGMADIIFVTAVVITRVGLGGRYFWTKSKRIGSTYWRDRIYMETFISLEWTEKFTNALFERLPKQQYDLEIHIDIGENGPTKTVINEMVGIVVGSGYKAKTKPQSYAASVVADKYT